MASRKLRRDPRHSRRIETDKRSATGSFFFFLVFFLFLFVLIFICFFFLCFFFLCLLLFFFLFCYATEIAET